MLWSMSSSAQLQTCFRHLFFLVHSDIHDRLLCIYLFNISFLSFLCFPRTGILVTCAILSHLNRVNDRKFIGKSELMQVRRPAGNTSSFWIIQPLMINIFVWIQTLGDEINLWYSYQMNHTCNNLFENQQLIHDYRFTRHRSCKEITT